LLIKNESRNEKRSSKLERSNKLNRVGWGIFSLFFKRKTKISIGMRAILKNDLYHGLSVKLSFINNNLTNVSLVWGENVTLSTQ